MICSFALKKREVPATNFVAFTMFLTVFPCFSAFYTQEQLAPIALRSIAFLKEQREQFVLGALYKRATVSDSLPSLSKKEQNRDSLFGKDPTLSLTRNDRFARKTKEQIPNPA